MKDKLGIANEMYQLDNKNRNFYDELTDEEKKKFSTYLMMKYSANVEGNTDLQEWYLRASNERVNKNFFDLNKHPKLQWLLCTSASPNMGTQRHYWLSNKKNDAKLENKTIKFLSKVYPAAKKDEIVFLSTIMSKSDVKELAKKLGYNDSDIKKELD